MGTRQNREDRLERMQEESRARQKSDRETAEEWLLACVRKMSARGARVYRSTLWRSHACCFSKIRCELHMVTLLESLEQEGLIRRSYGPNGAVKYDIT